jgi:hypothetical protein
LFTGVVDTGNKFIASALVTGKNCSLVLLILRKSYHRCLCHRRSFFSGVNDTSDKFIAGINDTADQRQSVTKIIAGVNDTADKFVIGVVDTAEQFIAGVVDTADKHSFAIISANFRKKSK